MRSRVKRLKIPQLTCAKLLKVRLLQPEGYCRQGSLLCSTSSMFGSYDYLSPGTLIHDKSTSPLKGLIPLILPIPQMLATLAFAW